MIIDQNMRERYTNAVMQANARALLEGKLFFVVMLPGCNYGIFDETALAVKDIDKESILFISGGNA